MRSHRYLLVVPLVAVLTGLAGCGGDKSEDGVASAGRAGAKGPSATPSQSLDPKDAQVKFAQCMRQNGVPMADPGSSGAVRIEARGDRTKVEAAMKKCRPYLQAGGKLPNMKDPKVRDQMVKFAQCMRQHGIDMPDPKPDGGIQLKIGKGGKAKADKAMQECRQFAPGMRAGTPGKAQ
ncbi:hypothetical protein ACRYCC_25340 [Actinomadura scrupuli]|uniref:hypothetical protein n=1 Tax=Actinomadura scrupuli TaxID=559629 RepID=UPI003D993829